MNYAKVFAWDRARLIEEKAFKNKKKIKSKISSFTKTDLLKLKWVWEYTVKVLLENWIWTLEELKSFWLMQFKKLDINPLSKRVIEEYLRNNNK